MLEGILIVCFITVHTYLSSLIINAHAHEVKKKVLCVLRAVIWIVDLIDLIKKGFFEYIAVYYIEFSISLCYN
jgi:hypothetical protein